MRILDFVGYVDDPEPHSGERHRDLKPQAGIVQHRIAGRARVDRNLRQNAHSIIEAVAHGADLVLEASIAQKLQQRLRRCWERTLSRQRCPGRSLLCSQ
jgi:hypothetical protein